MLSFRHWGALAGCLAVAASVVFCSIWQGHYVVDHLHWGLMLGNAKDLSSGLLPYKDIYILYGFLTTLVHAFAYSWLGENLTALIGITAFAYAIGLCLIYSLGLQITRDRYLALYSVLTCFLFHPITIYPWSNYIAFPLLLFGLILNLRAVDSRTYFISGLFFGLAVLAREGLAPAVASYLILGGAVDYIAKRGALRSQCSQTGANLLGMVTPLAIMLSYFELVGALPYWHDISWHLPKLYAREYFPHMTGLQLLASLAKQLTLGFRSFDMRWILVGFIILTNIGTILIGLLNREFRVSLQNNVKLSIFSLLLLSSTLHLAELFRISTGSIVGIINIYYLLKKINAHHAAFIITAVLLLFGITPIGSGHNYSTTNYFFPSKEVINAAGLVSTPSYFAGQRWSADARVFYNNLHNDLSEISKLCNIQYHYNQTYDAFLQVLSPFKKSQLAPFYLSDQMESLRPDLDWKNRLTESSDMIIFKHVKNNYDVSTAFPPNFAIYKSYPTPRTNFLFTPNTLLLIVVPIACMKQLGEQ